MTFFKLYSSLHIQWEIKSKNTDSWWICKKFIIGWAGDRGWKIWSDETITSNNLDQLIDWEENKLIFSETINFNNWTIIWSCFLVVSIIIIIISTTTTTNTFNAERLAFFQNSVFSRLFFLSFVFQARRFDRSNLRPFTD